MPRICGPIEYFTRGTPNGPNVGLETCLGTPEGAAFSLPAVIDNATGAWAGYDGAPSTFLRLPGPAEEYTASFAGPGTLSLNIVCEDLTPLPPGVHYALFIVNPIFEFVGYNRADSWADPVRLVFDAVSAFGTFTVIAGDLPVAGSPRVWGILPCCLPGPVPIQPTALSHFDLSDAAVLYMLSAIAASTYEGLPTTGVAILTAWLGAPQATDYIGPGAELVPGSLIAVYPGFAILSIAGTSNELQAALQILQSILGPVDCGSYSTLPLWRLANRAVHDRLVALGVASDLPILITGHSYGGAVAATLAADYLVAQPSRRVECVTFGSPKPGDDRLREIALAQGFIRVENYGDPVPDVPPTFDWWSVFAVSIPTPILRAWALFKKGGIGLQVAENGTITITDVSPALYVDMLLILENFLAIIVGLSFPVHSMPTYAHRLSIAAGDPVNPFPVSPAALAQARASFP